MADEILKIDANNKPVAGFVTDDSNQYIKMARIDDTTKGLKVVVVGGIDTSVTLLDVSANSITAPNSIYNLTAGIPVIFKSSDANTMVYLDETNELIGIGTTPTTAKLHILSVTEQLRVGYNASNYYSTTVGSTGIVTFNAVGAGSSFVFSDAATIATSLTTPLLIGGSSTTQTLTYQTTTGAGTTGADHIWVGGNNGATELMRLNNAGVLMIGTASTTATRLRVQHTTQTAGTLASFTATQTSVNTTDTNDIGMLVSYTLSVASASNQLILRGAFLGTVNTLTGGGVITSTRVLTLSADTSAATTSTTLDMLYLSSTVASGTVTTGRGLVIAALQGTTKYGIYDSVGTNWVNASGGKLAIGNLAPVGIGEFGAPTATVTTALGAEAVYVSTAGVTTANFVAENRGASSSTQGGGVFMYSNDTAALASGDRLGLLVFGGSSAASSLRNAALISSVAAENWVDASTYATDLVFETTALSSTTRAQKLRVTSQGSVIMGGLAALATTATDGFSYIPTCAGTPTGVPTAYTGKCAMIMDTTNHKLYVYDGSWLAMN